MHLFVAVWPEIFLLMQPKYQLLHILVIILHRSIRNWFLSTGKACQSCVQNRQATKN